MTAETRVSGPASARQWYKSRLVPLETAVSRIKPGDHVWVPLPATRHAADVMIALLGRVDERAPVEFTLLPSMDLGWYTDEVAKRMRINVVFANATSREAVNAHRADFLPWWVWGGQKAREEGRPGARSLDVAIITVSPPNAQGYCCFGASLWDSKHVALEAKTTLAFVDEGVPPTYGDTWIHVSEIDWFVESTLPRLDRSQAYPPADPWDLPIAQHVASLIHDRDTFQVGTGSTTGNMVRLGVLDDKHDLGYFAELTVPGTVRLAERGVITGRFMNTHPGKFVTTTAGGDAEEAAFIAGNPMFEFYSTDYIHHPGAIARNDNMVAINNALSVDLTGQIAAASIGPLIWSGTGGQLSYAMGAFMSKGGRSITVLPSTARGGTVSRLVPQLVAGQVVTVPRDIADIVITEYGIAHLLNKTQRQRAAELISIAHPDFRAELRKQSAKLYGA